MATFTASLQNANVKESHVGVNVASTTMTCATCSVLTGRLWAGQTLRLTGTDFGTNTGSARVVITDAPAWPNGTQVNQTVTAWADAQIDVTVVQGAHTTLAGKYLYAVNSSDVGSVAGFLLTLAPVCSNGVDDNADTFIDFPVDTDCADAECTSEATAAAPWTRVFVP